MMTIRVLMIGAVLGLTACDDAATTVSTSDAGAQSASANGEIAPPASLTANERNNIWPFLTDDAKLAAVEFIKNGGTLTQFMDT